MSFIIAALSVWFFSRKLAIAVLTLGVGIFAAICWYTLSMTLISRSSCLLYRNNSIIEQPIHLENFTLRNTNEAIGFMENAILTERKPFFVLMSYIKVHTALFTLPENSGRSLHGAYGDNVEELDWSVGRMLDTLKRLGVQDDTIVLFASDNGPFQERGAEAGFCGRATTSAGDLSEPLRGAKGQTWECGIRVPAMIRWSGHIMPGQVVDNVTSLLDIYPTLLRLWNVSPNPGHPLDGVSLWPQLSLADKDEETQIISSMPTQRDFLFHYCGSTVTAIRHGKFKAHYWTPIWDEGFQACPSVTICPCLGNQHTPPLLFDIESDPSESHPLDVTNHVAILSAMDSAIRKHQDTLVPVPNQVESLGLPWLFPCCNAHGWTRIFRLLTNSCQC